MIKLQAAKGFNDILPQQAELMAKLEHDIREVLSQYQYQQIILPIIENTELFKRVIGEVTDVVEKEMYTFDDRERRSLSMRPEGTAGCVRAAIEHSLAYNQVQKLWYIGPMFRHEKPQKGRYRQFYQCGVEVFGLNGPDIDVEILCMTYRLFKLWGIENQITLQINSLGTIESRQIYRKNLIEYFTQHIDKLDEDCKKRLHTNPLRILDSKNPEVRAILENVPKLSDYLDADSKAHFSRVCELLNALNIPYEINPYLVRGLDYYSHTVFEWVTETDALGAQSTVCAGGRYNGLFQLLGGNDTPAIGFAIGMERLMLLLEAAGKIKAGQPKIDIYMILSGSDAQMLGLQLAEQIRSQLPACHIQVNLGEASFKNQFKKADKSGAKLAFIIAEQELLMQTVTVKYLREEREQTSINQANILEFLKAYIQ